MDKTYFGKASQGDFLHSLHSPIQCQASTRLDSLQTSQASLAQQVEKLAVDLVLVRGEHLKNAQELRVVKEQVKGLQLQLAIKDESLEKQTAVRAKRGKENQYKAEKGNLETIL